MADQDVHHFVLLFGVRAVDVAAEPGLDPTPFLVEGLGEQKIKGQTLFYLSLIHI